MIETRRQFYFDQRVSHGTCHWHAVPAQTRNRLSDQLAKDHVDLSKAKHSYHLCRRRVPELDVYSQYVPTLVRVLHGLVSKPLKNST